MTKHAKPTKDLNELAYSIFSITIGEEEPHEEESKDPQAIARGSKGGKSRATKLSAKKRSTIAKKAAKTRWDKFYTS